MSLLVPGEYPSFTSLLHHHVSLGPQWVFFLHLVTPRPCLSWSPADPLHSRNYSTTMSLLVPSGSPSFTPLIHHHVSIGPQRVSFLHLINPPPCLSWSPVDLLPSPRCSTTMSLLVPSRSHSFTSLLHHHVSLGHRWVSILHLIAPSPCLSWSPAGLLPSPYSSTTMSLLVPSGSPSFTTLLHHHASRGPEWISFLHLIAPPPCLSCTPPPSLSCSPVGLLPSHHCSTTTSILVPSGSPSFTSLLHHHVSLGPQRVSVIPPSPCLSWSSAGLLPSPHSSITMSLLVPSGSPSFTSFLHHHVSLGPEWISFLHFITPPPCLSWSSAGISHPPHSSITMSLLVPSGSPSFTTLLHHHVSLGPQRVSFLHHIAPPPCLSWSPAGLLPSPHYSTTMSLLGPSGSPSFTTLLHHNVSLGPQRVSFLHHIAPPPCLSWSPRISFVHIIAPPPCRSWSLAGLLPSPHCSTIMYLLVPIGSPSFTSLLHNHVSLGPQRVSFLHIITPPPCLSWSRVDLLPPPHCSTIMLLLVPSRSPSFTPIAPPPCLYWSPTGLLPSHHCSTTMSLLVPSGSPSFTSLLHHHVSLGPQGSPSFTSLLHPHVSLGSQRVSFLHHIAPPPSLSLLVPSGSPSFTPLLHHHVYIGPQRVSFLHPLLHRHVPLGPQRVSFLHLITPPPCLS